MQRAFRNQSVSSVILASEVRILPSPLRLSWHRDRCSEDMKQRFNEVLRELEQERQRVDEDLRRFAVVAACHDDGAAPLDAP
jgi:hypothetical protein